MEVKIDKFSAEVEGLKKRCDQQEKCTEELGRENAELKYRLERKEQYSCKDDVFINGVPWEKRENLREMVKNIGEKLGMVLYEYDPRYSPPPQ